ncbi:NAD(P)H-dependent oxidoreductase [Brevibacillus panacihumi]|nr:NAD(P)H-dependent oxidoreductase [Brevibacillus panacihumi]
MKPQPHISERTVLQFPFYWYSAPPLLKNWFDEAWTYGWAYGPGGVALRGKECIIATERICPPLSSIMPVLARMPTW